MIRKLRKMPLLAAGLLSGLGSQPALAQLEEIKVTARRVEESLQDAPISVTAFTERTLENARIRNINDLANMTPNLTFEAGETGRRQTPVIRGLGIIDSRGFDNNVGVFIDGVFMSGRASQNIAMLDVERVEIVRGPQSALYGRNTFAGAIDYITKKPDAEFDAKVEATAAQGEMYELMGSVSGPLLGETLAGRVAVAYTDDNGLFTNAGPLDAGGGIGGYENKSITGTLRWTPSDAVDINLTGFYSDEFMPNRPLNKVENNCGELNPANFANLSSYDLGVPAYFCGEVPPLDGTTLSMSPDAYSFDGETWRLSLDMDFDLGWSTLTSTTSYTKNQNLSESDLDRTQAGEDFYGFVDRAAFEALGIPVIFSLENFFPNNSGVAALNTKIGSVGLDQDYFSQELRLTSNSDGRLRWVAGLFYFEQSNRDSTTLGIDARPAIEALGLPPEDIIFLFVSPGDGTGGTTFGVPNPILPNVSFKNGTGVEELVVATTDAKQYAAFASVEFDLTEKLIGTAELRYTYEERELDNAKDIFFFTPRTQYKNDWSFVDPRFILRYQASDEFMVYGSAAKGSRSGGLNVAISDPAAVPFDEETNWTYELGFKSSWFENMLQFNLTAFYIDWKDAQFRQRIPTSGGGSGFLTVTTNATGITNKGFEAELVAAPFEGFTVGTTFGYADPEFDDGTVADGDARLCDLLGAGDSAFPAVPVSCVAIDSNGDGSFDDFAPDISGNRPIRTAKQTASFFAEAIRPISPELDLLMRFDIGYRSKIFTDNVSQQFSPSRTLANLRLGVVNERFDVTLWVENLLNDDAVESTQTFQSDLNKFVYVTTGVNINPRRLGLTARYRFGAAQ